MAVGIRGRQVKLQVLNLGCKLWLAEPETCGPLFAFVLDMARFDTDFDIRDRARLMRAVLLGPRCPALRARGTDLFLAARPCPELASPYQDRAGFALNTLSHVVNHAVRGYAAIPDFPDEVPDSDIREPVAPSGAAGAERGDAGRGGAGRKERRKEAKDLQSFYSNSGSGSGSSSESGEAARGGVRERTKEQEPSGAGGGMRWEQGTAGIGDEMGGWGPWEFDVRRRMRCWEKGGGAREARRTGARVEAPSEARESGCREKERRPRGTK